LVHASSGSFPKSLHTSKKKLPNRSSSPRPRARPCAFPDLLAAASQQWRAQWVVQIGTGLRWILAQNFFSIDSLGPKNLAHGSVHPVARQRALHIASPSPRLPQAAARPHPAVTHSRTPAQVATREQPSAAVPEREEEPPPPRSARRQRSRDSVRSRLTCRRSRRPLPSGCPLCLTPKPRPRAPDGGRLTAGRPALKQRRSGQRQRPGHGTRPA
jgi:hypothetical protein